MTKGLLFWLIMVLSLIFWGWQRPWSNYWPFFNGLVVYILLFLLGWQVFGFVVH